MTRSQRIRPLEVDESPWPSNSALQAERARALLQGPERRAEALRLAMVVRLRRARRAAFGGGR